MARLLTLITLLSLTLFPHSTSAAHPSLSLHALWSHSLAANADSVPAYGPHIRLRNGKVVPAVYVLAANNGSNCDPGDPVRTAIIYAFNARSGSPLWSRSTVGPSRCSTASPAVDPTGKWVYAAGLDGKVHRYNAGTGSESIGHGWPITATLMPDVEKISANLTIGTNHLYVTTSGFIGDQGHYEGHLVTIDLSNGKFRVFNTVCSNITQLLGPHLGAANYCPRRLSGLFGRGEGAVDPVTHAVYVVSGNGPWNGRTDWGDSVLKLDPTGSHLLDSFTPANQASLAAGDQDLGSTGPALLPTVKLNGTSYHLLVQGGKGPACDGCSGTALRLLNRDNLSGQHGLGHLGGDLQDVQAPGGCEVLTAPAVWKNAGVIWVFYANDCGTTAYRLSQSGDHFRLGTAWSVRQGGSTPVLAHGILWVAHDAGLDAYGPKTGQRLLHLSIGSIHWQYPLIRSNILYLADQNQHLTAYAIG
jgi:outer membrane protein assembly factor BamB